jgi:hypothetical protein
VNHDHRGIGDSACQSKSEEEENEAVLSDDEENEDEDDGGQQQPRGIGKGTRAERPQQRETEEEPLIKMAPLELLASYTSYAMAHAAEVEGGSSGGTFLARLSFLRAEMEKRCIIDILFPLLAHINPCVQVTAAIDILSLLFERSDQALSVLQTVRRGGRGVAPFIAGVAFDTYVHRQFEEIPRNLIQEASSLYTGLHRSVRLFNTTNSGAKGSLVAPERLLMWDRKEHRGTFISITSQAYGQHVGMGNYQIYKANQLDRPPNDGEKYIVHEGGALESERAQERIRGR